MIKKIIITFALAPALITPYTIGKSIFTGEYRTEVENQTPTNIFVTWVPVTFRGEALQSVTGLFVKDSYINIPPYESATTIHTRDALNVKICVCQAGNPSFIETTYKAQEKGYAKMTVTLDGQDIVVTESQ